MKTKFIYVIMAVLLMGSQMTLSAQNTDNKQKKQRPTPEQMVQMQTKQIVKTFYVAQNAQEIILMGRADLLNEYLTYFKSNGVTAKFKLQPVTYEDSNLVNMLFFNKIEEVK